VKINGAFAGGPSALAEHLAVIWLTPQMDRLFLDSAGARRRFLDRLVYGIDPDHAGRLARYEHALQERSQLLRQAGRRPGMRSGSAPSSSRSPKAASPSRPPVASWWSGWARPWPAASDPSRRPLWRSTVRRRLAGGDAALAVEDRFRAQLAADRPRDAESGGAQCGPHPQRSQRHPSEQGLAGGPMFDGEQKALLISIVLAQARVQIDSRGRAPILLLDEVVAHLDAVRRAALFEEILALDLQAWLTGTEAALFAELGGRAQFFGVRDASSRRCGTSAGHGLATKPAREPSSP